MRTLRHAFPQFENDKTAISPPPYPKPGVSQKPVVPVPDDLHHHHEALQIMIKRIPSRMKATAHEKLRVDSANQFEWLSTTPEGEYTTLWIKHDSKSMVRNAVRMKLNWERELPPNSRDRKSVSSIIIEQVAPRSFIPLLSKL